jgi:predicted pyridoxine 5'-phosphate oxidase superfamily flavin-nucleotide-binding protein
MTVRSGRCTEEELSLVREETMSRRYTELTFTDSVKSVQEQYGTRASAERMEQLPVDDRHLSPREQAFVEARDGFYMASVNQQGWPYVQFRGGPVGFLRVVDECTLGYADYRGNRQYITTGNVRSDDRVALILMDYPNRRRLKVMARMRVHEAADRPDLVEKLHDPDYPAEVERVVLLHVEAFDWNCPQHITPRYTVEEIEALTARD